MSNKEKVRNSVINLSKERVPFAKLDKISYEIGKPFLNNVHDGFDLVENLWQEIKDRKPESTIEILKVSSINIVLSNILGILAEKDFERTINLVERYNLEGSRWYITDNLVTRAVRHCYGISQNKVAKRVEMWIKSVNKWERRLGVVSGLIGVKNCGMDVDWCLNILQKMLPEKERIVNKAIAWTLRDLSKKYHDKVKRFIEQYKEYQQDSSIKYIVRYGGRKLT